MGFPGGLEGKESACNAEDSVSTPQLGKSLGVGNGNPLRYSWRNPWTEEPGRLHSSWGHKESDMTEQLTLFKGSSRFKRIWKNLENRWGGCKENVLVITSYLLFLKLISFYSLCLIFFLILAKNVILHHGKKTWIFINNFMKGFYCQSQTWSSHSDHCSSLVKMRITWYSLEVMIPIPA